MTGPALIVVDVQRGFDDAVWGRRDNPGCEPNIGALIEHWRAHDRPVVFDRPDPAGQIVPAEQLAHITATNLHEEFATVIDTATALADR